MNLDEVASHFDVVKRYNVTYWAYCPVHNNQAKATLKIFPRNKQISIECLAGCEKKNILNKVGLTYNDLRPNKNNK